MRLIVVAVKLMSISFRFDNMADEKHWAKFLALTIQKFKI
jgi:hypothetical protein